MDRSSPSSFVLVQDKALAILHGDSLMVPAGLLQNWGGGWGWGSGGIKGQTDRPREKDRE